MSRGLNFQFRASACFAFVLLALFMSHSYASTSTFKTANALTKAAEQYVRLGLELGQYDKDYVDAYLGPKEWQVAATTPRTKEQLATDITTLKSKLSGMRFNGAENLVRHKALSRNVRAMDTRARMLNGETFSFVDEAFLIYDVVLPEFDFAQFDEILVEVDLMLPGDESLASRVDAFRSQFDVPQAKVAPILNVAIEECRTRSKQYIPMPEAESFTLEYVTGKSWSGYNWYQGNNVSLMQINQDFPMKIDRAIGLGCHEGYPGHHVWNVLIEESLIKEKGWIEFTLYPLFSPYGVIAEGSAEYGVELAFPGDEKAKYEREVLYPLAGLDPKNARQLAQLNDHLRELKYSRIAIAQLYLEGDITREEAVTRTVKYSLVSEKRAEASVKFIEQYRAYVLNYSIGEDLIAAHIDRNGDTVAERWAQFKQLLTQLSTASDLIEN